MHISKPHAVMVMPISYGNFGRLSQKYRCLEPLKNGKIWLNS